LEAVSYRAVRTVFEADIELATSQIASCITRCNVQCKIFKMQQKRHTHSRELSSDFLLGCVQGIAKAAMKANCLLPSTTKTFRWKSCPFECKKTANTNSQMETTARQPFQVFKDHNNRTIQEMLKVSNVYCYRNSNEMSSDDEESEDKEQLNSIHTFPQCSLLGDCGERK
jgi:hypothetical protein